MMRYLADRNAVGPMSISETELREINPPQWPVRLPEESGGGYMGLVEFVHQIHCLVSPFLNPIIHS